MGRPRLAPSNPGGLTMLAKLRSRLRPPSAYEAFAIVLAFLALGSGSYAAISVTGKNVKNSSLTGKDIKNSSLTSSDVKNRSLLTKDFKPGQLPRGAKGDTGQNGTDAAANVVVRRTATSVLNNNLGTARADCQAGEKATGGGGIMNNASAPGYVSSYPSLAGTAGSAQQGMTPTAWTTSIVNNTGSTNLLNAFVVCVSR